MKQLLKLQVICLIFLFFTVGSCYGPVPSYRIGTIPAQIKYSDIAINRSITSTAPNVTSRSEADNGVIAFYEEYYNSIGSEVNLGVSLTPTIFRVPYLEVLLGRDGGSVFDKFVITDALPKEQPESTDIFYLDFTNPLIITPPVPIRPGLYDLFALMTIDVGGSRSILEDGTVLFDVTLASEIVVELPGYTDADLPNIYDEMRTNFQPDHNTGFGYDRFYLGDNKFRYSFGQLQPDFSDLYGFDDAVSLFLFSKTNDYKTFFCGLPGEPTSMNYEEYTSGIVGLGGRDWMLEMPFDGIEISRNSEAVIFVLNLYLDGIIKIYDVNGDTTVVDGIAISGKSDDIVVLSKGFWDRFNLTVEQY